MYSMPEPDLMVKIATKWIQFDNKYMRNDIGKAIDEV